MQQGFMDEAIRLSRHGMEAGKGGPFGCVIVLNGKIIGKGHNRVLVDHDPTRHAEMVAISDACRNVADFQLAGCELYTSAEPCPMCMAAIYWARVSKVYYCNTKEQSAKAGFDDRELYEQLSLPVRARKIDMDHVDSPAAIRVFEDWKEKADKIPY